MQLAALALLAQDATDNVNIASPTGGIISVGPSVADVTAATPPQPTSGPDTTPMDTATATAVSSSTDLLGNLNITNLIGSLSNAYVAVTKAVNAGSAPGVAVHPTPGTVTQLPGGAVMRVNADGSTTVTQPNGQSQTVMTNGQVVAGTGSILSGISNSTLLLAGAGLLAVLFLGRSR